MINDIIAYHDRSRNDHLQQIKSLTAKGFRILSLSMYGDPKQEKELYAAVWVQREGPQWTCFCGYTLSDWLKLCNENQSKGLYPTIITATGEGNDVRCSGVFEFFNDSTKASSCWTDHELNTNPSYDIPLGELNNHVARAKQKGKILRWATVYGYPNGLYCIALWEPNTYTMPYSGGVDICKQITWNCDGLSETADEYQARALAQKVQWAYPAFVTVSPDCRYFSVFRDNQVEAWVARHNMSSSGYQAEYNSLVGQGYYPLYVQGGGIGKNTRFAALFVKGNISIPRTWRITGTAAPALAALDEVMKRFMLVDNVRAGVLAVAKEGRLVYARGYNWSEPNYPITQPNSIFRIASCGKAITNIAIHQLFQSHVLKSTNFAQDIVNLASPPGMTFNHKDWVGQIQVQHLIRHTSGMDSGAGDLKEVVAAFNHTLPVKDKYEHVRYVLAKNMLFQPGANGEYKYSNSGYSLLGMLIENKIGTSYVDAVKAKLFYPLGVTRPVIGGSKVEQRLPNEVFYHGFNLGVGKSLLSAFQPMVALPYGVGDMEISDAYGGWVLSAPDFVKVFTTLSTVLDNSTKNDLLSSGGWERGNGFPVAGTSATQYVKGGGMGGSASVVVYRTDGLSYAVFFNTDTQTTPGNIEDLVNPALNSVTSWPSHDLFSSVGIGSAPTAFASNSQKEQHIIYQDTIGHLQELWAGNTWSRNDLTAVAEAPLAAGLPFAFTTGKGNVKHVVYRGWDDHIYELWAGDKWLWKNLTSQAKAPIASGNPTAYTTDSEAVKHIVYRDVQGHIYELWAGDNWNFNKLTEKAQVPLNALAAGNLSGYTTDNGKVQHIIYRDWSGHIHELWAGANWTHKVITIEANIPAASFAAGDPIGYVTNNEPIQHVVYLGKDGHIHKLQAGGFWSHVNLTETANVSQAALPAGDPKIYATDSGNTLHIVYRGKDGHIHELWINNAVWQHTSITIAAKAPQAAGDPVGYVTIDGTTQIQHIVYLGQDGHLHELWAGMQWQHTDLGTV